jgi:hypothetical protein
MNYWHNISTIVQWFGGIATAINSLIILYLVLLRKPIQKFWNWLNRKKLILEIEGKIHQLRCDNLSISAMLELQVPPIEVASGKIHRFTKGFRLRISAISGKDEWLKILSNASSVFFIAKDNKKYSMFVISLRTLKRKAYLDMIGDELIETIPDKVELSVQIELGAEDFKRLLMKQLLDLDSIEWDKIYRQKIREAEKRDQQR